MEKTPEIPKPFKKGRRTLSDRVKKVIENLKTGEKPQK